MYFYIYELKEFVSDFLKSHFKLEMLVRGKILKENSINDRSWSSASLLKVRNYTENANGDVPITVENVWHFYFL